MISDKIQEMLDNMRLDNRSGASEFIEKALEIIKYQIETIPEKINDIKELLLELSKQIINSRPSMAPLINTIGYLIHDIDTLTIEIISQRLNHFYIDKTKREELLEKSFRTFINRNYSIKLRIMLISYSSTILTLLKILERFDIELYILESRPLLEGYRTAEILSDYFRTHIIVDAAIGKFMEKIDLILIGVDSILRNGAIINKIGTFPLTLMANEYGVRVYAVGDSFKYNLKSHYGLNVQIEKKPIEEVYDKKDLNENIKVHNYYFDITPPKYITGIISDLGILTPKKFVKKAKKILPIDWYQKFLKINDQFIK